MKPVDSDHYAILELKPGSSMEEIKSQYRRLAKRYHPDLNNNDAQCQEQLLRVNAAYVFLSDTARKAAYDARPKPAAAPAASMPKPPPAVRPQPFVAATGYHAPIARHPLAAIADIRMTRSGWLGATAVGVLLLLGIGLSMDSGDQGRSGSMESAPPAMSADRPGVAAGDSSVSDPGQPPASSVAAPAVPFPAASGSVPPLPPHRLSSAVRPFRVGHIPEAEPFANIADAQSKVDGLLSHGTAVSSVGQDAASARPRLKNAARRALLAQLASDLDALKATRGRIKPAIAQFSRQHTAEAQPRVTEPLLTDIRTLKAQRQFVRDDLQALSTPSAVRPAVPTGATPLPAHAAVAPAPPSHVSTASVVMPASAKPADRPASKPKSAEPSAPSFITWGK